MKRAFDIIISLVLLMALSPIIVFISLVVMIKLGSPILFKQERPGLNGEIFNLYKFRSMLEVKDENGRLLSDSERLTPFGKILRSTSMDELPSLFCVLSGKMSIVGPRPLLPEYLPLYNEKQAKRHNVRPGITGWAQVNGRNAISWEKKFELDIYYVNNHSVLLDFKILMLTLLKVFKREGINQESHDTTEKFKGNE